MGEVRSGEHAAIAEERAVLCDVIRDVLPCCRDLLAAMTTEAVGKLLGSATQQGAVCSL